MKKRVLDIFGTNTGVVTVKIMTFRQLSGLLAGQGDAVKLLRSVQQVAVLVQGNWVVRSECLFPRESVSEHNGVPGEVMCRARDYIVSIHPTSWLRPKLV